MRSKLFVPASRPELFAKALAGDADAIAFDLEDSVPPAHKAAARQALADWLASHPDPGPGRCLMVRSNAPGTADFAADLAALPLAALSLLNLPKVDAPEQVQRVARQLADAETAQGLTTPLPLLVNIETPRALRRAAELAAAHPRVVGLQLGLADLFEPAGIDRGDATAVHAVMLAVRLAAAEAGVYALDSAFTDLADADGLRAECRMARRLGYAGKSCIHPQQVAVVNAAFAPDPAAVAAARRIVDAADAAAARGHGAVVVDGRMVDTPHVQRARALLAGHAAA
jgi:citrate lyase subunit beta/citryl-CoA lyase